MNLINEILDCESKYSQLTSERTEYDNYIRFQDNITPEIPLQSYTYIKRNASQMDVKEIIKSEIRRAKKEKREFIRFVFNPLDLFSGEIPELSSFDYHCHQLLINDIEYFDSEPDSNCLFAKKHDKTKLLDLLNEINSSMNKTLLIKHSSRWANIKIEDKNLKTLAYKHNNKFIGSCDLCYHNKVVKLEDFEVIKSHRQKGVGDRLLSSAISLSRGMGLEKVYLIADRNDWVSDYYQRRGFELFLEFNSYTLFI